MITSLLLFPSVHVLPSTFSATLDALALISFFFPSLPKVEQAILGFAQSSLTLNSSRHQTLWLSPRSRNRDDCAKHPQGSSSCDSSCIARRSAHLGRTLAHRWYQSTLCRFEPAFWSHTFWERPALWSTCLWQPGVAAHLCTTVLAATFPSTGAFTTLLISFRSWPAAASSWILASELV